MKLKDSLPLKIALMGVLALLMLIPLAMIQGQIRDRQQAAHSSRDEVSASWGRAQTLTGPVLQPEENSPGGDGNHLSPETLL